MNGSAQTPNARNDRRHCQRVLQTSFLMVSFMICIAASGTDAKTPTILSDEMKLFSYPNLEFQISFPSSWIVSDKSGDLVGEHLVEGRISADTPSLLNGKCTWGRDGAPNLRSMDRIIARPCTLAIRSGRLKVGYTCHLQTI